MKIMIVFLFLLFLIPLVSAQPTQTTLGIFQQDSCVELKQTCTDCSFVNITSIISPNSTEFLTSEIEMTKNDKSYSYTFCNTTAIGNYIYWTYGNPGGVLSNPHGVNFEITKTGQEFKDSFTIPLIIPIVLILLTAGLSLFLAFRINFQGVKTILIGFSFILLLFSIIYSLQITNDILAGFETVTFGFSLFYRIIIILTWIVGISVTIYMLFKAIDFAKHVKGLK